MSAIYQYFPAKEDHIHCVVCKYAYRKDAPLSTLQKHLRVKHRFSIRRPLSPTQLDVAIGEARVPVFSSYRAPSMGFRLQNLLNHGEESTEATLSNWIIKEKIPLALVTTDAFYAMLRQLNPRIVLPTPYRLRQLVTKPTAI